MDGNEIASERVVIFSQGGEDNQPGVAYNAYLWGRLVKKGHVAGPGEVEDVLRNVDSYAACKDVGADGDDSLDGMVPRHDLRTIVNTGVDTLNARHRTLVTRCLGQRPLTHAVVGNTGTGQHDEFVESSLEASTPRPRDSLAPFCSEAPKRNTPADQEAQGDSAGSVNQLVAQALHAALRFDTGKGDTPTLPEAAGDTTISPMVTVKAPESSPAPKDGEREDANELPLEKSGFKIPTHGAAASKRPPPPPPPASNDSAETTTPGLEEPPAKTL
ncbi:hypothetical protein MRX96_048855 [Rhipicephalus microplus]